MEEEEEEGPTKVWKQNDERLESGKLASLSWRVKVVKSNRATNKKAKAE